MTQSFLLAQHMPVMCCCVPLRLGVFMNAFWTIVTSVFSLIYRKVASNEVVSINGGYSVWSRTLVSVMLLCGCLWGALGVLGTWENKTSYIKIFNYFQMFRVVAWCAVTIVDVPLLMNCEEWITNIDKALKDQGWNPVMYKVAMGGNCITERISFFAISFFCLMWFSYLLYEGKRYEDLLETEPRYLLRVPKGIPSGSFYAQGLNERSLLAPSAGQTPPSMAAPFGAQNHGGAFGDRPGHKAAGGHDWSDMKGMTPDIMPGAGSQNGMRSGYQPGMASTQLRLDLPPLDVEAADAGEDQHGVDESHAWQGRHGASLEHTFGATPQIIDARGATNVGLPHS